ncbi:hypothetical protein IV203_006402 [Nitzschia inconspicua]|uniref:Uncharacterized protein n=1 Tax=Nitzschia inconspicua TaxID=303405 RepID=A0A9K3KB27_9STRA|nr:hypothetical protein IV203_006402 [Nitzschia inconspicua]
MVIRLQLAIAMAKYKWLNTSHVLDEIDLAVSDLKVHQKWTATLPFFQVHAYYRWFANWHHSKTDMIFFFHTLGPCTRVNREFATFFLTVSVNTNNGGFCARAWTSHLSRRQVAQNATNNGQTFADDFTTSTDELEEYKHLDSDTNRVFGLSEEDVRFPFTVINPASFRIEKQRSLNNGGSFSTTLGRHKTLESNDHLGLCHATCNGYITSNGRCHILLQSSREICVNHLENRGDACILDVTKRSGGRLKHPFHPLPSNVPSRDHGVNDAVLFSLSFTKKTFFHILKQPSPKKPQKFFYE